MKHLKNWFEAALVAAFLLVMSAWADGPDDIQAAADAQAAHMDAIKAADAMSEGERIATRVCRSLHAERALVLQLESGEYVCRRKEQT